MNLRNCWVIRPDRWARRSAGKTDTLTRPPVRSLPQVMADEIKALQDLLK